MPIYEYACRDCRHQFESLRPMSQADEDIACPHCGKENARRKPSVFYSETGGHSLEGSSSSGCGSCSSGSCAGCGH